MISPKGRQPVQYNSPKFMDLDEFVEKGYLHEINRQFLNPLGLALTVRGSGDHVELIEGIWDCRDDPEGIRFESLDWDKIGMIRDEMERRRGPREEALGYWIQDEG